MGLFRLIPESFPASHLVKNHRIHFLKGVFGSPHDDIGNTAVHDHLRAEETWPYLRQIIGCDIKPRKIERAPTCMLTCLEECVHLGMHAPAPLIVGAGRDIVVLSPARIEFYTVHLFSRGTRVSGGNDRIVFIDDNRAEVAPQAGTLVGTPQREVKKIVMPVGPHEKKVWKSPVLKKHGLKQGAFPLESYQRGDEMEYYCEVQNQKNRHKQKFYFEGFMPENVHRTIGPERTDQCQKK
jgi:hypothetical protein